MKENVRKQWRLHLCCGRFRPKDCSGTSHLAKQCLLIWNILKNNVRIVNDALFCFFPFSDWSRTVTAGGAGKKNILVNSDSVASNSTSTVRKVSDSSTGSAPKHHQGAWVGLWMCLSGQLSLSGSIAQSQTLIAENRTDPCLLWAGKHHISYILRDSPEPCIKISPVKCTLSWQSAQSTVEECVFKNACCTYLKGQKFSI